MVVEKKSIEIKIVEIQKDCDYLSEKHKELKEDYKATYKEVIRSVDKMKEDIVDLFHLLEGIKKDLEETHKEEEIRETRCETHMKEIRRLKDVAKDSVVKRLVEDLSTSNFFKFIYKVIVIVIVTILSTKGIISMDIGWLKLW